jgi:hypothetical protein
LAKSNKGKNMFFKKSKKVTLTFYTREHQSIFDLFPPQQSTKLLPEWFAELKKNPNPNTMRSCPGFIDLFKRSISIPLWRDHAITHQNGNILDVNVAGANAETIMNYVDQHHPDQYGGAFANSAHLKLITPYVVSCDTNTPFLMHDACWHKNNLGEFTVPPGHLEFKHQHGLPVNMYFNTGAEKKTTLLEAGSVIAYLTPLDDVSIEIKTKVVSNEEFNQFYLYRFSFNNAYKKMKQFAERIKK